MVALNYLIPNFLITCPTDNGPQAAQLCELKLISAGATYYKSGSGDRWVDVRARQLPKLYKDKAKNIDRLYCGAREGQRGPIEKRLEEFGDLSCFVVGQFCEVSPDLHNFLKKCAVEKSRRLANVLGRPPSAFEESQVLQQLRWRLSVCSIRAQSSCLLSRLGHTGESGHSQ